MYNLNRYAFLLRYIQIRLGKYAWIEAAQATRRLSAIVEILVILRVVNTYEHGVAPVCARVCQHSAEEQIFRYPEDRLYGFTAGILN